jgi:hypothetical protein
MVDNGHSTAGHVALNCRVDRSTALIISRIPQGSLEEPVAVPQAQTTYCRLLVARSYMAP